jgi:hypothetical protein
MNRLAALTLAGLGLLGNFARAEPILYGTGFEAPTFAAGQPIDGQDGWYAFAGENIAAGTITNAVAATGSQSLKIDGGLLDLYLGEEFRGGFYVRTLDLDPVGIGAPIVDFSVDARIDLGTQPGAEWYFGFQIYDRDEEYIGGLALVGAGRDFVVFADNRDGDTIMPPPLTLTGGTFYTLRARLDFAQRTMAFSLDGQQVGSLAMSAAPNGILDADLTLSSNGTGPFNSVGYFDNYRVVATVVPEPSGLALVVLGLVALGGHAGRGRLRGARR